MPEPTSRTLRLLGGLDSPLRAREGVADVCQSLPTAVLDDALLLVSEVVTNCVKHATGMVTVAIECDDCTVAVAVADESSSLPVLREPTEDDVGGRGLQLLDRLASAWGCRPTSDGTGKVVWFRLAPAKHG